MGCLIWILVLFMCLVLVLFAPELIINHWQSAFGIASAICVLSIAGGFFPPIVNAIGPAKAHDMKVRGGICLILVIVGYFICRMLMQYIQ